MARLGWRPLQAALLTIALALPLSAQAEDARRVVVQDFEGPGASRVRAQLLRSMRRIDSLELVSEREAEEAADRLGVELANEPGYAAVGSDLGIHAFISGRVEQEGRRYRAVLQVREGRQGIMLDQSSFGSPRLGRLVRSAKRVAWRRVRGAVMAAEAGEPGADARAMYREAPPGVDLSQDHVDQGRVDSLDPELYGPRDRGGDDGNERVAVGPRFVPEHSALDASVGVMVLNRGFDYQDVAERSARTRPYSLPLGPALALDAEWFPGAHFSNGFLAHVGLTGGFEQSFLLSSDGPEGASFETNNTAWQVGAEARLPLGRSRVTAHATYGVHTFSIEPTHPSDPSPDIATVEYEQARFGLGSRVWLGGVRIHAEGSYLLVMDPGQIDQAPFFPGTTVQGFEGSLGMGYPLGDGFEVRGDLALRMYLLDLGMPDDGNPVASGAIDRYIAGTVGMAWSMEPEPRFLGNL